MYGPCRALSPEEFGTFLKTFRSCLREPRNLLVKPGGTRKVSAMETHRIAATVATLLTLAAAQADVYMGLAVDKTHYQRNAFKLDFDSGELNLILRDGLVILDGACVIDPQLFFFGPSQIPPCPLGATGFVAQGDIDRDGIRDDNQYWSVLTVIPAFVVEPSRPELAQLFSAPPSKLPRPLPNFRDDSVVTFYDISTAAVTQYDQSRYELILRYGSIPQIETANLLGAIIGDGSLSVTVTGQDIVGSPLTIAVPVLALDLGNEAADKVRVALAAVPAITNFYTVGGAGNNIVLTEINPDGNDPTLNIDIQAGTAQGIGLPVPASFDTQLGSFTPGASAAKQMREELVDGQYTFTYPRLNFPDLNPVAIPVTITPIVEALDPASRSRNGFRFTSGTWDGDDYQLDPRLINEIDWTGNDRSNIRPGDQIYFSILNTAEDFITFPPTVPQNPVLLSNPTVQSYTLPPFFFEVGEEGVMNLDYRRNLPSNGVAYDVSERDFRAKVRMVDSYAGYAQVTLPLGTSKNDIAPTGNVDRDSMSNLEEFAFQFPTNEDINASAREQFVPGQSGFFGIVQEFNRVVTKVVNPIIDDEVQPTGPAAPFLDAQNHIVFEVPVRPRTGTTVKYDFLEAFPPAPNGKVKKPKKLKLKGNWEVTTREVQSTTAAIIEVKLVTADTRETVGFLTRPSADIINLTQEFLVLRSLNPVNPADPLPDLRVQVSSIPLK